MGIMGAMLVTGRGAQRPHRVHGPPCKGVPMGIEGHRPSPPPGPFPDDRAARRLTARVVLLASLCFAFDLATILPVAAVGYMTKRALRIDVVRGVDMLPDALIEGGLAGVARRIRGIR